MLIHVRLIYTMLCSQVLSSRTSYMLLCEFVFYVRCQNNTFCPIQLIPLTGNLNTISNIVPLPDENAHKHIDISADVKHSLPMQVVGDETRREIHMTYTPCLPSIIS
jgi:hypothetical protein